MKRFFPMYIFFLITFSGCAATYDDIVTTRVQIADLQRQVDDQAKQIQALANELEDLRNQQNPTPNLILPPIGTVPVETPTTDEPKTEPGQCKAITKAGTQCSRNAQSGSEYCWQHAKSSSTSKTTPSSGSGTIYNGPKGGQYKINSKGNKVYIRKKK